MPTSIYHYGTFTQVQVLARRGYMCYHTNANTRLHLLKKAELFGSRVEDSAINGAENGGHYMQDKSAAREGQSTQNTPLFEDRYLEIMQKAEDIICKQSMQRTEDTLRSGRGLPHFGRYKCMIRCRLDAPLRRALERYCQTRGMGICDAIRLAIFALVSRTGLYSEACRESFWEE